MNISYIRKPVKVQWGYNVINNKALYNAGTAQDFELHSSDQTELVYKILGLAGITINKPGLDTIATQKTTAQQTQEKQ